VDLLWGGVSPDDIHAYRMEANAEEILRTPGGSRLSLTEARRKLALVYHPDRVTDELLRQIMTKRMQEIMLRRIVSRRESPKGRPSRRLAECAADVPLESIFLITPEHVTTR